MIYISLLWFDRLQYSEKLEKLIIFEFFETNIFNINQVNKNTWDTQLAYHIFDKFTFQKHSSILKIMETNSNLVYIIILYTLIDSDKKIVISYSDNEMKIFEFFNFEELQSWFLKVNNIDGDCHSKSLGKIKSSTEYSKKLLFDYWGADINDNDDQGLEFTKKLLSYKDSTGKIVNVTTKGFDFDLFLFFETDCYLLNIEFAFNRKGYLRNYQCTPMNYCWGYGPPNVADNKMKYNKLWQATKLLNGDLAVLNYNDHYEEFGFSVIKDLDYNVGFLNETKYIINKDNFEKSLYATTDETSLMYKHFQSNSIKVRQYDETFFNEWPSNKKKYKEVNYG